MYHAFHTLYDYLVDDQSMTGPMTERGVTGGICILQNVQAFDQRHGYPPLPHPLPLLPDEPSKRHVVDQQKGLRSLRLGRVDSVAEQATSARQALAKATNAQVQELTPYALVEEYQRFERQRLEEKLSIAEARKVRWLLVYSTLQMLVSITKAPKEVGDSETPSYPLCVLITGCPDWVVCPTPGLRTPKAIRTSMQSMLAPPTADDADERISIHPDCEAESAEDYFSSKVISRSSSNGSLQLTPPPLKTSTQLSRAASIRSSVHSGVHALHRSFVGSLSKRQSQRVERKPSTAQALPKRGSFCQIIIEGYGNGAKADDEGVRRGSSSSSEDIQRLDSASLAAFDFGLADVNEEPVLEDHDMDNLLDDSVAPHFEDADLELRSASVSSLPALASDTSGSNRSSAFSSLIDSPTTEISMWASGDSKRNSSTKSADDLLRSNVSHRHSYQQKAFNLGVGYGVRSTCYSVSAGCYTPTGMINLPLSKFHSPRSQSVDSAKSFESSTCQNSNHPAGEIEEEEMRGRRRSRAPDRLSLEEVESEG